ncbi:hypothetical protein [Candidatus Formimonas warabiya]|uniref:Uncharacterized protein n=1 Tax=Formimonas warabiya TaxID=1761012 RepID=A0A3G1KN36_FORW1|nr:hypothetical protein [Candidatus Formimonas warabiya]ATW23874.1 hypothetical protein DCMF_02830 [Candidatus Formimonas warabiya]
MSDFNHFMRNKFFGLFGRVKWIAFLIELRVLGRLLVVIATIFLFLYALFFPQFWIILILFWLFLALLAMCCGL